MTIEEKLKETAEEKYEEFKKSIEEHKKEKDIVFIEFIKNDKEKNKLINDLKNYPHAFVLACAMDRQIKAEKAWSIPYNIKEVLKGDFSIEKLRNLKLEEYKNIFNTHKLHRFKDDMAEIFYKAVFQIEKDYDKDASKIWSDNPSSATVVSRFLDFDGIGIKIATMATNILAKKFKIPLSDYYSIDISPDVHVKRVFKRMGLIKDINKVDKIIYKARSIYPEFPGIIDHTCWKLGTEICKLANPKCNDCVFEKQCPKNIN